jgi:hypothetical protein
MIKIKLPFCLILVVRIALIDILQPESPRTAVSGFQAGENQLVQSAGFLITSHEKHG